MIVPPTFRDTTLEEELEEETVTVSLKSAHHLRRWVYAPVIAAVAALAVASGVGVGAADTTLGAVGTESSSAAGLHYEWRVHNFTEHTLTAGYFQRDEGAGVGSALEFGGTTPWAALAPGEATAPAFQPHPLSYNVPRTWGTLCYMGQIWHMPRSVTRFDDLYVVAMGPAGGQRLMVTPDGGGATYDVDMNAYGEPC